MNPGCLAGAMNDQKRLELNDSPDPEEQSC